MKRMIGICLILSLLIALSACSHPQSDGSSQEETAETKGSTTSLEKETELEQETMGIGKDKLLYIGQASIRITTAEGKVIYIDPYVGSGYEPSNSLSDIRRLCPDARITEGLVINGDDVQDCDQVVEKWLNKIGLI